MANAHSADEFDFLRFPDFIVARAAYYFFSIRAVAIEISRSVGRYWTMARQTDAPSQSDVAYKAENAVATHMINIILGRSSIGSPRQMRVYRRFRFLELSESNLASFSVEGPWSAGPINHMAPEHSRSFHLERSCHAIFRASRRAKYSSYCITMPLDRSIKVIISFQ